MKRWLKGKSKTNCDRIKDMLSPYQDDELEPDERQRVEMHLKSCPICREELNSLQKTMDLVRQIPVIGSSRSFAITERKAVNKTWNARLKVLSGVTALVAVILVLIFIGDVRHYFDALPLPPPPFPQPPEINQYFWPVRETEFGLLGTLFALAVYTLFYWVSRHRKQ